MFAWKLMADLIFRRLQLVNAINFALYIYTGIYGDKYSDKHNSWLLTRLPPDLDVSSMDRKQPASKN